MGHNRDWGRRHRRRCRSGRGLARLSHLAAEQHDFGKGTSSRSTKLVHGGVRYLEQGNIPLVLEALKERGIRQNAPHLVAERPFIVPIYAWWEGPFYSLGLKLYHRLSGKYAFGPSRRLPEPKPSGTCRASMPMACAAV